MARTRVPLACVTALLLGAGTVVADEKKEPSAKSQEAAKLLKKNLAKFRLSMFGLLGKYTGFVLVTDRDQPKAGPNVYTFVITEKQAEAVIDGLVRAGQFDQPRYVSPPGLPNPGWYLEVSLVDKSGTYFQWQLGDEKYDLTVDAAVGQLLKTLEGDSKKALQKLVDNTAKKR
jgi:hypothetical protein